MRMQLTYGVVTTAASDAHIRVIDATERKRFEIRVDGELAGFTVYRPATGHEQETYAFVHTEIDEAYAHRGLGEVLVRAAMDEMIARGIRVLPFCPFVRRFIAGHEDYLDLVPEQQRARFELSVARS